MERSWFGLIDLGIVAVAAFGWGTWQYISITREIARDKAAREKPEADALPETSSSLT